MSLSATSIESNRVTASQVANRSRKIYVSGSSIVIPNPTKSTAIWTPSVNAPGTAVAYVVGSTATLGKFAGTGDIVISTLGSRQSLDTHTTGSDPAWSPDGSEIAYVDDGGIGLMSSVGRKLPSIGGTGAVNTISWSPNGNCIVASSGQSPASLVIIDARSDKYIWLSVPGTNEYYPAWSPNGNEIAFEQLSPNGLFIWNVRTGQEREVAACNLTDCTQDMWPAWSANGTMLAFGRVNGGPSQIWVMPSSGGRAQEITNGPEQHNLPSW